MEREFIHSTLQGFHFSFLRLEDLVKGDESGTWREIYSHFGTGGLCWALAATVGISIVTAPTNARAQEHILRSILLKASIPVEQYPVLLQKQIVGEIGMVVDANSGGITSDFHTLFSWSNDLLRYHFAVELFIVTDDLTQPFDVVMRRNAGVPILVPIIVTSANGVEGHLTTCVCTGKYIYYFEPNSSHPLVFETGIIDKSGELYKNPTSIYTLDGSQPLLGFRKVR